LPGRRRRGGKRRKDQAYATHATRFDAMVLR